MEGARFALEVVAGVQPGELMPEHTRRYVVTTQQWEEAGEKGQIDLLAETNGKAQGYASLLMMQPGALNWVRVDWVWF